MRTIKTWLATIAVLLCSVSASAHDFEVDGIYYNILSKSDKTVEVTYKGNNWDAYSDEYYSNVTIPSTVTYGGITYTVIAIGEQAFRSCKDVTGITIPNTVTSIGWIAFSQCIKLTEVTIPSSVRVIEERVFSGCSSLSSVSIPESVTSIGAGAFDNTLWYNNLNDGLVYINNVLYQYKGTMPENTSLVVKEGTISISSFENCEELVSVTIPESVISIASSAFSSCTNLATVTVPQNSKLTRIESNTFHGCSGLTSINFPDGLTSIGEYAFFNCSNLTDISIPMGVTSIEECAFEWCTDLTSIVIPEGVTKIEKEAFRECSNLISVTIPKDSKLTSIGEQVFSGCTSLTNITIPESVKELGAAAFRQCTAITSIIIPKSIEKIGEAPFRDCNKLNSIKVETGNINYDSRNDCNAIIETSTNTLLQGCSTTIIPNSTSSIGSFAFSGSGIASIVFPESVTSIGSFAFNKCSNLTAITIPENVQNMEDHLFSGCDNLLEITLNTSYSPKYTSWGSTIGSYSVKKLSIGKHITSLNYDDFYGWGNLEQIVVDSDNPVYDSRGNCNAIIESATNKLLLGSSSTVIPNSVEILGQYAFIDSKITSIFIPDNVTQLEGALFAGSSLLTKIHIQGSPRIIGVNTFTNCSNLKSITCESLTPPTIFIPEGVPAEGYPFNGVSKDECILYVPAEAISAYKEAKQWKEFLNIQPIILRDIVLLDNTDCFVQTVDEECASITYTRTLSKTNTWNALYVPFEIPMTAEFCQNYDVAYFNDVHCYDNYVGEKEDGVLGQDGVIDGMDMEVLKAQEGSVLNANYPYLIRAKNTDALNMNIEVEDATLYSAKETTISCSSVFMKFDVTGIYNTQTAGELKGEYDVYAISGGGWKQALNANQQLKPFRLYLKLTSIDGSPVKATEGAMSRINIRVQGEDTETGIDELKGENGNRKTAVYDLSGRRVQKAQKGIFIQNGKKVIM